MDNLQSSKLASEMSALQNRLSTSNYNQTGIDTSQGYSLASTELDSFFSGFSSDISSLNSAIGYNLSDLDSIVLGLSSDSSSTGTDFSSLGLTTDTASLEELIASFPSSDSIDFGSLGLTTDLTSLEELTASFPSSDSIDFGSLGLTTDTASLEELTESFPSSDSIDFGSLGFTTDTASLEELTASFPSSDSIDFGSLGLTTDLTSLEELIASFSSGSSSTDLSSSGLSTGFTDLISQSSSLDQLASYLAGNNEIVAQSTAFNEIMNSQGYTEEYLQDLYDNAQTAAALYPESTATGDVEENQTATTTSHAAELGITDGEWARMNANLVDGKILVYGHTYYDKYNDKGAMPPGAPSIGNYKNLIIEGNEYNDTYSRSAAWFEYEEIQAGKKDTYDGTYNGVLLGVRNWSE